MIPKSNNNSHDDGISVFSMFFPKKTCTLMPLSVSNDEPCMVRPTLIDINPNEIRYYPCMISLNKRAVSCNVLSPTICVPNETKT